MGRPLFLILLLSAIGCPNTNQGGFAAVPDGDDDDSTLGDDDDAVGDDDDSAFFDPCGEFTVSADAPPTIDHGGPVGTRAYEFPASCSTFGDLQEFFGGWVDGLGTGLDVSATFAGSPWPTLQDAVGQVLPVDQLTPFTAELDLGNGERYLAPEGLGLLFVAALEPDVSWQACFAGHGGVWTREGGEDTVTVPDPLHMVCVE